jgi:hypothetical protein
MALQFNFALSLSVYTVTERRDDHLYCRTNEIFFIFPTQEVTFRIFLLHLMTETLSSTWAKISE